MKKIFLFIIICISSFMIYTNNVKAENSNSIENFSNVSISTSLGSYNDFSNQGNTSFLDFTPNYKFSSFSVNFNDLTVPRYSNFFTIPFSVIDTNGSLTLSCANEYISGNILSDINFSTTYADGSHSQNSGTIDSSSNIYRYCNSWTSNNRDLSLSVSYRYSDNLSINCNIAGDGSEFYAICPISYGRSNGQANINQFSISLTTQSLEYHTYRFRFPRQNLMFELDSNYQILDKLNEINNKLQQQNTTSQQISNNTNEIKNDIKSDNTSGAENSADDLKNNSAFQDNTGLSGVISMPLTFVNSLTNTCQPINLNIPYMDVDVTIPCMQSVITDKMPLLANLIKIIVNGFIVYRILLDIFQIVRNAKNPEDDRIEVLDL